MPEIQGTTQQVALAKCRSAAQQLKGPCITEDTALSFHALNGLPGPYIKDFLGNLGHDGLNRMLAGFDDKAATAICTFAYCAGPDAEPMLFEGTTLARIVPARGPNKFGWDPIFEVDGTSKTFAEMDADEKNVVSHRSRAVSYTHLRAHAYQAQGVSRDYVAGKIMDESQYRTINAIADPSA